MREMSVKTPGNSIDCCQHLRPNPRRMGLPRTVTEWRALREQRLNDPTSQANHSSHELTAYEIMKMDNPDTSSSVRRSERIKKTKPTQGGPDPTAGPSSRGSSAGSNSQPILTLAPSGPTPAQTRNPEREANDPPIPNLGHRKPSQSKQTKTTSMQQTTVERGRLAIHWQCAQG